MVFSKVMLFVEFEHLLLGQLQTEAQTDMGHLGPERRWARGWGVGGTRSREVASTRGSPLGLMIWPCRSMTR